MLSRETTLQTAKLPWPVCQSKLMHDSQAHSVFTLAVKKKIKLQNTVSRSQVSDLETEGPFGGNGWEPTAGKGCS